MTKNKNLGIRADDELHYKVRYIAAYYGRSLNNLVIRVLQEYIRNFEAKHGPIPPMGQDD